MKKTFVGPVLVPLIFNLNRIILTWNFHKNESSEEAYIDHYRWASQHPFKKRKRYTLKADPISFQPQDRNRELIDIIPFFTDYGITTETLRQSLKAGYGSKPFFLKNALPLYNWLQKKAVVKLFGTDLEKIRRNNLLLASPDGTLSNCCAPKVSCKC